MKHLTDIELQSYLDSSDRANHVLIEEHVSFCSNCRERLESYTELYIHLSDDSGFELDKEFTSKVIKAVGTVNERPGFSAMAIWAASLTALVTILALLGYLEILTMDRILGNIWLFSTELLTSITALLTRILSKLNVSTEVVAFVAVVLLVFELLDYRLIRLRHRRL